jgi:amino acid transporter
VGQALGQLLPLAIGVALSPIPIIAVILVLFSARTKSNGAAFLLGWLIGIGAVAAIALVSADAASVSTESEASNASSWVNRSFTTCWAARVRRADWTPGRIGFSRTTRP